MPQSFPSQRRHAHELKPLRYSKMYGSEKLKLFRMGVAFCCKCRVVMPLEKFYPGDRNLKRLAYCSSCKQRGVRNSYGTLEGWCKIRCGEKRNQARKSGVPFDLTPEFLQELWHKQDGKCYYTGIPMLVGAKVDHQKQVHPETVSIDRQDSSKFYTQDNVVLCCFLANVWKGNKTTEETKEWCRRWLRGVE